ncbi:MAG: hypothetical protein M3Q81_05195 [bacterium]|nr:hypothetical protein [bacterium]
MVLTELSVSFTISNLLKLTWIITTGIKHMLEKAKNTITASIAGQEPSWKNAASRMLAGQAYQPIPNNEVARNTEYFDEYYDWNNQVRIFGININRVAESFNLAKPKLSQEMISNVEATIQAAISDYEDLKARDRSKDPQKLIDFHDEMMACMDRHQLYKLDTQLSNI